MAVYAILEWVLIPEDLGLLVNEDGIPVVFDTVEEAVGYAKENCAFNWQVVKIDI